MNNLYIYCEGDTERIFVEKMISPFLTSHGIYARSVLSGDGRSGRRGGIAGYSQVKRDLTRICREHPNEYVTTLIDYAPVLTVPLGFDEKGTVYDTVRSKERAIEKDLKMPNLLMNFELHEFEAYLYCNPEAFEPYGRRAPDQIRRIIEQAGGPEMINTSPDTLPSRRLDGVIPGYTNAKKMHTTRILENVSLEQIRSKCTHLDEWLDRVCEVCGV